MREFVSLPPITRSGCIHSLRVAGVLEGDFTAETPNDIRDTSHYILDVADADDATPPGKNDFSLDFDTPASAASRNRTVFAKSRANMLKSA
jgi:hypothetical protein